MSKIICHKCGTENESKTSFCTKCGEKLVQSESETISEEHGQSEVPNQVDQPEEQENVNSNDSVKSKKNTRDDIMSRFAKLKLDNKKNKYIFISLVVAFIAFIFILIYSQPKIVSIHAEYNGDTEAGVVLDKNNKGFIVYGTYEGGKEKKISNWKIDVPETLEMDGTSIVVISYKDLEYEIAVECSTSAIEEIYAVYDGDRAEGIVLDENNSGIKVYAKHKNKTESEVTDWKLIEPKTLTADENSEIEITYMDLSTKLLVKCSTRTLVSISAKYDGKTTAGTVINKNDITVTAKYKNGDSEKVTGWTIDKTPTLEAGNSATVNISYEGVGTQLVIECSTLTEAQYKNKCENISYSSLARYPDDNKGKYVKFQGRIVQVMEGNSLVALRVNVTNTGYGYYDDTVYVLYSYKNGQPKFLEDDIITFYGVSNGLYSYKSVLGATITIPEVIANYIDLN